MSENAVVADNQQGTLRQAQGMGLRQVGWDTSETTRQTPVTKKEIIAYLNGAIHDATLNKGKRVRFGQKNKQWLEHLKVLLDRIENLKIILEKLGINVGRVHNPSKRVNPDYWRIFILADSHLAFARIIGS